MNVASFVGAGTLREHEIGYADRPLSDSELHRMCDLLAEEMRHGALGVASALIYPPETAYTTPELTALARVAAAYDGMYASHIRSEGAGLVDAVAGNAPSPIVYETETKPDVLAEDREIERYALATSRDRVRVVPAESMFETAGPPADGMGQGARSR